MVCMYILQWFWRNEHAITYALRGHKQNIEAIAKLYRNAKDMLSISTTPVPYIKVDDKTAIIALPDYKWDTDEVWGFRGKKGPGHICEESFVVKVGDDDGAYQRLRSVSKLSGGNSCQSHYD